MKRLTLVVDERELSTIRAALLLLQEQINALPEDLAEMMGEHGPAMTEQEVGKLARRLMADRGERGAFDGAPVLDPVVVEVERSGGTPISVR